MSMPSCARALLDCGGGMHALGHVPQFAQDVVQLPALRQAEADAPVARQLAGAGQDQVAGAGEPGEGLGTAAQLHPQARDFGQAARDQGRARVGAQTQAVGDAGGDGHDVLYRAADLHAGDIAAEVDAQARAVQGARRGLANPASAEASVSAVGKPRATSSAKLGPDSAPQALPAGSTARGDLMRQLGALRLEALAQPHHRLAQGREPRPACRAAPPSASPPARVRRRRRRRQIRLRSRAAAAARFQADSARCGARPRWRGIARGRAPRAPSRAWR